MMPSTTSSSELPSSPPPPPRRLAAPVPQAREGGTSTEPPRGSRSGDGAEAEATTAARVQTPSGSFAKQVGRPALCIAAVPCIL